MKQKQDKKHLHEIPLDNYEKELKKFLDKGKYTSDKNLKKTKKMLKEAAKRHIQLQKTKRVTIRLNRQDLIKVKAKAKKSRIPYQRLISALIHKYAEGDTSIII